MQTQKLSMPKEKFIKILLCALIIAVFWVTPAPAPLTQIGMRVIGTFIGTVLLLSLVDTVWPVLLAVVLLSQTGLASLNDVIAGTLGNWSVYFILMSFVMTNALNKVGFTDRLVAKFMSMKFVGKSPWVFTISMATVGMLLASFIDQIPATAFMLMFANRVYEELGYTKKDAYPHVTNILVVFAVVIGGAMTPISHGLAILGMSMYEAVSGEAISLFTYLAFGVPTGLVLYVVLVLVTLLFAKKVDVSKFENFDVQKVLKHKGKMDLREIITVTIFFATIFMWIFPGLASMFSAAPWIVKLNSYGITFWAIISVLAMALISVDDEPLVDLKTIFNGQINWAILFFISIGVYLGGALSNSATGLNDWITANITPLTSAVAPIIVVFIITAAGEVLTNFASNVSTISVMTTVGTSLALASTGDINAAGIALCTTMAGSCAYLLPSSFGCIAMLHGDEWSNSKTVYLYGMIMMIVSALAISFVGYPIGCMLVG